MCVMDMEEKLMNKAIIPLAKYEEYRALAKAVRAAYVNSGDIQVAYDIAVKMFYDEAAAARKAKEESEKHQTVMVNLTGDKWLVDIAGEVIDQIAEQSKGGRVVIKRDDQKDE